MRLTRDKDLNRLVEGYLKRGWTVERQGRHIVVKSPQGPGVTVPKTPSDHRTYLNTRALLRRVERNDNKG